jgi:hypothetical protein
MVDFGSGQGLSVFATTGIVCLFRGLQKSENAVLGQKMLFQTRITYPAYTITAIAGANDALSPPDV